MGYYVKQTFGGPEVIYGDGSRQTFGGPKVVRKNDDDNYVSASCGRYVKAKRISKSLRIDRIFAHGHRRSR